MKTLSRIVEPLPLNDFIQTCFGQKAIHIKVAKKKFAGLFGWESLNRILNSAKQPHPSLKLTRAGKTWKPANAREAVTEAARGATLILDDIDCYDETLGQFMDSLSEEIPDYSRINAYLSF